MNESDVAQDLESQNNTNSNDSILLEQKLDSLLQHANDNTRMFESILAQLRVSSNFSKKARQIFDQLDVNHAGNMDVNQFVALMSMMGQSITPEEAREHIDSVDINGKLSPSCEVILPSVPLSFVDLLCTQVMA